MISYYVLNQGVPVAVQPPEKDTGKLHWIDLSHPTEEECREIGETWNIPVEYLRAALDLNERPRIESGDGILLVITRAPVRMGDDDNLHVPFYTCPIACILTSRVMISVCRAQDLAKNLLGEKIRETGGRIGPSLMLTLFFRISTSFIEHLQELDCHVNDIEKTLQKSMQNRELLRMLHIEKSLIYFLMALKGNTPVLEKLGANAMVVASDAERNFLYDVLIENKQATDMASIYTEIMGSLGDTFGAIVSNNLNKVMKFLASLTIVFMIPSIIGALYGMNVPLPFQESPLAFGVLCFLCLGLSLVLFKVLRKLDWL